MAELNTRMQSRQERTVNVKTQLLIATVLVLLCHNQASATHYPYTLDQPTISHYLNEYWNRYGVCEGPTDANGNPLTGYVSPIFGAAVGGSSCNEWNSLKMCWTNHSPAWYAQMQSYLMPYNPPSNTSGVRLDSNGMLWQDVNSRIWFDLQYHYDQQARYICAVYNYYIWRRDNNFLLAVLPTAEKVMDYMWNYLSAGNGYLVFPGASSGLPNAGVPTTWMDCLRTGYISAWENETMYTALMNMSELEAFARNTTKRDLYKNMAAVWATNFDNNLWNSATNRYMGWKDSDGGIHDAGYTFINTEALARGLGDTSKAHLIFDWLDNSRAEPIAGGVHYGSTDIYQCVVAPRANTSRVPDSDWDPWSVSTSLRNNVYKYGLIVQDGGTCLFMNYYDVMARLKWLDADNAYDKLVKMLYRCAGDQWFLGFGTNRKDTSQLRTTNDYGENCWELPNDGIESGISGLSMLYGFMGVQAKANGLNISPKLPSKLLSAQCSDIYYRGTNRTIAVARGSSNMALAGSDTVSTISETRDMMTQDFMPTDAFNEVGVFVSTNGVSGVSCDASLYVYSDGIYKKLCTRRIIGEDKSWWYFTFQWLTANSRYRIALTNVSGGSLSWYRDSVHSYFGYPALKNRSEVSGNFDVQINSCQINNVISQQIGDTSDVCPANGTLQDSFRTDKPFSRVGIVVGTNDTTTSSCTLTLYRNMGNGYVRAVASQRFNNVVNCSWLTMSFADQPAGLYSLIVSDTAGTIGWWRNSADVTDSIMDAFINNTLVPGDRVLQVDQNIYSIQIIPDNINVNVNAGDTYVLQSAAPVIPKSIDIYRACMESIGSYIKFSGRITYISQNDFCVEAPNRLGAILVTLPGKSYTSSDIGRYVTITGFAKKDTIGRRYVLAESVVDDTSIIKIQPLGMINKTLLCGPSGNPSAGTGQPGLFGGIGINIFWLLVRTTGKVISYDAHSFTIDDGTGGAGVRVNQTLPSGDPKYVVVTGVATGEIDQSTGNMVPVIYASDIQTLQ